MDMRSKVTNSEAQLEVVRDEFESAFRKHYPQWSFASDGRGGYHNERTELAWQGWAACFIWAGDVVRAVRGVIPCAKCDSPDLCREHGCACKAIDASGVASARQSEERPQLSDLANSIEQVIPDLLMGYPEHHGVLKAVARELHTLGVRGLRRAENLTPEEVGNAIVSSEVLTVQGDAPEHGHGDYADGFDAGMQQALALIFGKRKSIYRAKDELRVIFDSFEDAAAAMTQAVELCSTHGVPPSDTKPHPPSTTDGRGIKGDAPQGERR